MSATTNPRASAVEGNRSSHRAEAPARRRFTATAPSAVRAARPFPLAARLEDGL